MSCPDGYPELRVEELGEVVRVDVGERERDQK
jgi:hypothetical protein